MQNNPNQIPYVMRKLLDNDKKIAEYTPYLLQKIDNNINSLTLSGKNVQKVFLSPKKVAVKPEQNEKTLF